MVRSALASALGPLLSFVRILFPLLLILFFVFDYEADTAIDLVGFRLESYTLVHWCRSLQGLHRRRYVANCWLDLFSA